MDGLAETFVATLTARLSAQVGGEVNIPTSFRLPINVHVHVATGGGIARLDVSPPVWSARAPLVLQITVPEWPEIIEIAQVAWRLSPGSVAPIPDFLVERLAELLRRHDLLS